MSRGANVSFSRHPRESLAKAGIHEHLVRRAQPPSGNSALLALALGR
jgi:hypothetical protein